jgi:signal peptidase II
MLAAIFLDQVSKLLVDGFMTPRDAPKEIIGSLLRFKLAYNPYGVFSISFGISWLYYVTTLIGVIVFSAIGLAQRSRANVIVFGLIVGGALGNFIDRLRIHYVIDFIDMGIGDLRWFTYNLADAFITVGAVYLIVGELFFSKRSDQ